LAQVDDLHLHFIAIPSITLVSLVHVTYHPPACWIAVLRCSAQVDDLDCHFIDDITIPSSMLLNVTQRNITSWCLFKKCFAQVDDLHRHFIDDITIPSSQGKGLLRRIDDVFDCWFESGSMPYGQVRRGM
jgi:hypothetical protein